MKSLNRQGLVLIGRVTKAHSIRGEIKVWPYSGQPENFLRYTRVLLAQDQDAVPVACIIEQARAQKNSVLLRLDSCTNRNQAEQLVHAAVYVQEDDLPEPEPDEFYLRDLEGRQMKTEEGETVGRITGLLLGSNQNIARVKNGEHEYLIPLIPEFLVAVEEDEVRVSLPPGLLNINR